MDQTLDSTYQNVSSNSIDLRNNSHDVNITLDYKLTALTQQNEINQIKSILNQNPNIHLSDIQDKRQYTLIHIACLNNHLELLQLFLEYVNNKFQLTNTHSINNGIQGSMGPLKQSQYSTFAYEKDQLMTNNYKNFLSLNTNSYIKEWLDKKTDEGFTALHFAAFRGNIKIIQELEKYDTDIYTQNHQGLNVLHIASQGDQPLSLVYFKQKNMDLNCKDFKGSTCLHWAAYLGCENSVNYLTSWNVDINVPDEEGGLTPLHLGVISGNSRVVRKLLIKGADKTIKDKSGKIPADLARENEYFNILQLLEDNEGLLSFCNIKPKPKPARKKLRSLLLFFIFYGGAFALISLFFLQYVQQREWIYTYYGMEGITFICFLLSWICNPGYLKAQKGSQLLNLLIQNENPSDICPECEIIKPNRSRHCEICNSCVQVYDHHCPWINNCVGAKNHKYFLIFIILTWLSILYNFIMIGTNFYYMINNSSFDIYYDLLIFNDFQRDQNMMYVFTGIVTIVGLTFFFPLSLLVLIQIKNFTLNKTTSERFGYNQKDNRAQSQESQTSYLENQAQLKKNQGHCLALKNCYHMCYKNQNQKNYKYVALQESFTQAY